MSQLQVTGEAKIRDIQGPVVANSGVITALDGAASQYVRGDGTLADFPTSSGGGSSVSYYLNSSVSQGTIGGVAYRELSKEPIIGAGTDIAIAANGYVASYITDANDPDVLSIPGGNFNCEFYFSVNNNTGNPFTYAELYKYDGTTFTLLGSSVGVPEYINQGTIIAPYYFAIPVPTSALALTDRLAIRIYVNVDGRTVTLHTENSHLCQVVTTLSKGMVSLNNLTDQSQYLTTGTSGTNFAIVSSGDTHTFNLPIASASNTGKLSSTDWSTFNNKQNALTNPITGTGASGNVAYFDGTTSITAENSFNYDASTNRLGVNTSVPNATIGANAGIDSGYSLLLKNDNANYNGIGFGTDSTYGNLISTEKLGTALARNLTLLNQSGFVSLTEAGNLGLGLLTPNTGLDIYNGSNAYLWLHTATSGITGTDGVRLALFSTNGANLRNFDGSFSITAEGDFSIITIGAENFRVNSSDGSIYQSKVANAMLKSVSGVITAAVAGTDYLAPASISGTTNTISKFTSSSALGNSNITDTGSLITLGSTTYVSSGNFGVGTSSPSVSGVGIDIYSATSSSLRLHTATSGTTVSDGAGINFSAANNLGITNYEAGAIDIVTNGNSGVYIASNGYVGINGATPSVALTVTGAGLFSTNLSVAGLTTGQILFPTSGGTLAGSSNLFWDNTNGRLSIGASTNANRRLTVYSSSDAEHLALISNVPAITFGSDNLYTYYSGIGMATAANNFVTGAVAGDLTLGAFYANKIILFNSNTNTQRMNLNGDGAVIFSGSVTGRGAKSQIVVDGNSVGCGISLTNTIVGANRRNWGIFTEENVEGDFVIKRSTTSGGSANTNVLSLSRDGAATFSSSVNLARPASGATLLQLSGSAAYGDTSTINLCDGRSYIKSTILTTANGATDITFGTYNDVAIAERMRITSGGNVGIGTSSPSAALDIDKAEGLMMRVKRTGVAGEFQMYQGPNVVYLDSAAASGNLAFATVGTERMRITSGGNVGIGTASPSSLLQVNGESRIYYSKAVGGAYPLDDSGFSGLITVNSIGTTNSLSGLAMYVQSNYQAAAGIFAKRTGTDAADMVFYAGSNLATERMRITSDGRFLVGATATDSGCKFRFVYDGVNQNGMQLFDSTNNTASTIFHLFGINNPTPINIGSILRASNTNAVLFSTTSDYRLKEDYKQINGLEKVLSIKVYDFKWKDIDSRMDGVIAHELAEVLPYAVNGEKDALDKYGNEFYQGVDYSKIVPVLVKATQEIVEKYDNKIALLEAQIEELKQLIKNK